MIYTQIKMYHIKWISGIVLLLLNFHDSFSTCVCTQTIGFSRCSLIELTNMEIRSNILQESIANIDASTKSILPDNVLLFPNMQQLKIQCNIHTLNTNSLANQNNLKDLDLSENFISSIPNDFFASLPELQKLNLSHNNLENPTLDTFYALNNVIILDISFNKITNLQLGIFDEMKKLKNLKLAGNQISDLTLGLFDQSKNLLILDVASNHLTKLPLGLFDQSKLLQEIDISGNKFKGEVPLGTYDAFKNVVTLKASNSQIEKFPLGVFDETLKISTLDLSKNTVRMPTLGIFDRLQHLKTLILYDCKISEIPGGLFDKSTVLETLDLSYNILSTLPDGLFNQTQNFKYLNLSHNRINDLPLKLFQYTNLVEIDISYNKFVTIKPELLNMETLEKVYAQNNHISILAHDTFATIGYPLKYLDIRNNRLVYIENEYFLEWTANLKRMEIFGNPWDCKCLDNLLKALTNRFIEYTSTEYLQGKKPVCVDKDNKICNVNMNNSTVEEYYKIYIGY